MTRLLTILFVVCLCSCSLFAAPWDINPLPVSIPAFPLLSIQSSTNLPLHGPPKGYEVKVGQYCAYIVWTNTKPWSTSSVMCDYPVTNCNFNWGKASGPVRLMNWWGYTGADLTHMKRAILWDYVSTNYISPKGTTFFQWRQEP